MYVFLFTDIEGSTRLWEEHTSVMAAVIARHDEILRQVIAGHGGRITKHTGDGITAAFDGGFPLACALEAQLRFAAELWGEIDALPIRAGLHAGDAEFHLSAGTADGDYFGPPVNATARVMSAAWGGQILLTPEVTQTSPLPDGATLLNLGRHLLKNVTAPKQLYQLDHPQSADLGAGDVGRRQDDRPRTQARMAGERGGQPAHRRRMGGEGRVKGFGNRASGATDAGRLWIALQAGTQGQAWSSSKEEEVPMQVGLDGFGRRRLFVWLAT